ncbi:unnamed protein product [Ectocarpus sp. CCAP 1310/34]|nr:unnamed protein product [Ectocarpus sp. CCAP 1310/34]
MGWNGPEGGTRGADAGRRREGAGEVGSKTTAASFSFAKQVPWRSWFSDASTRALGGVCMETRVFWRYELPMEVQGRTVWARQKGEGDLCA